MEHQTRRFSAHIALAVVIALVSCMVFLGLEASHDCIGGGCRICCQILNQIGVLKNTANVGAGLCLALAAAFTAALAIAQGDGLWASETLVSHKVKLSN